MKMKIIIPLVIIGYVLMAGFTYGYAYHQELKGENAEWPELIRMNAVDSEHEAAIDAAFWPLYWPCHVSRLLWSKTDSGS